MKMALLVVLVTVLLAGTLSPAMGGEDIFERWSREAQAAKDRASREKTTYFIAGAIAVAGIAIGAGIYFSRKKPAGDKEPEK